MPIAFDAASSASNIGTTALSWSHTIGGNANRILVVATGIEWTNAATVVTGITYNSVALTKAIGQSVGVSTGFTSELWYLLEASLPVAGTYTITISYDNLSADVEKLGSGISMDGAKQEAPEATASSSISASTTINTNITTISADAWVVDGVGSGTSNTFVADSPQVERTDHIVGGTAAQATSNEVTTTVGTYNLGWTASVSSDRMAHVLVSLAPAAAAGLPPGLGPDTADMIMQNAAMPALVY